MTTNRTNLDPVTFEVLKNAFASVCNEMSLAMEMSAYSLVISEGADYSGTLYDPEGHLVCQGEFDLPAHCGTVPFTVAAVLETVGRENMLPGDVFIMNDPYRGGTHNNDVRLVKPVFRDGEIVGFVANTGHWPDVGGSVPGTLYLKARSAYQEGVRLPPVRIARDGETNEALVEVMLANMRVASERRGDLNAHFASVNAGERRLLELCDKYGVAVVHAAMAEYQDYAERLFRAEVAGLPDGTYTWEDFIDYDPNGDDPERPLRIVLNLTIAGDDITYDFTGTDPAAKSSVNATYPGTVSCIFCTTRAIFSHIPLNHGLLRAMNIIAPEHTLVRAVHPEPVSGMAAAAFEKIVNCCLAVYSHIAPERTMACGFNLINVTWGGHNTDTGREFVAYIWSEGGLGARATQDGINGMLSFFAGSTKNIPVEVLEREVPVLFECYEFRQDSAGAGRFQGGVGSHRILRVLDGAKAVELSSIGDRSRFGPWGLLGGGGAPTQSMIRHEAASGESVELGAFLSAEPVHPGDRMQYRSSGGGGYGAPEHREIAGILEDVIDEYVSPGYVRDAYGVVIAILDMEALDVRVDLDATRALRAERFGPDHAMPPGADRLPPDAVLVH